MNFKPLLSPIRQHPWVTTLALYSLFVTTLWFHENLAAPNAGEGVGATLSPTRVSSRGANRPNRVCSSGCESGEIVSAPAEAAHFTTWAALESKDFATFISNLRAIGCPDQTIRRIVTGEVRELIDQDRLALLESEPIPYWDSAFGVGESDLPGFQNLAVEEAEMLTRLLGSPGDIVADGGSDCLPRTWRFGAAMNAKKPAFVDILGRADQQIEDVMAAVGEDGPTPDQQVILAEIQADKEAALNALLSPDEREDFELRNSPLADEIRSQLRTDGRSVTEEQFREMFRARRELDARIGQAALAGEPLNDLGDDNKAQFIGMLEVAE